MICTSPRLERWSSLDVAMATMPAQSIIPGWDLSQVSAISQREPPLAWLRPLLRLGAADHFSHRVGDNPCLGLKSYLSEDSRDARLGPQASLASLVFLYRVASQRVCEKYLSSVAA